MAGNFILIKTGLFMKAKTFFFALLLFCSFGVWAQGGGVSPKAGDYLSTQLIKATTSLTELSRVKARVEVPTADKMELSIYVGSSHDRSLVLKRAEGNLFFPYRDGAYLENFTEFFQVRADGMLEHYYIQNNKIDKSFVMYPESGKAGDAKKEVDANAAKFSVSALYAMAGKQNQLEKQRKAEEEAARKAEADRKAAEAAQKAAEAKEKAAADRAAAEKNAAAEKEALKTADLCTPLKKYIAMGPEFAALRGAELAEETEENSGDPVWATKELLPLFRKGVIETGESYTGAKQYKVQFYTNFASEADAKAHRDLVKACLDAGFNAQSGWKATLDSDIWFYKSGKTSVELMIGRDWDDEGDTVYKVLVQFRG